jgi:hypothetical protein
MMAATVADRGGGEDAGAHVTQQGDAMAIADEAVQAAEVLRQAERKLGSRPEAVRNCSPASKQAAAELRQAAAERKARGLVARVRAAWRGSENWDPGQTVVTMPASAVAETATQATVRRAGRRGLEVASPGRVPTEGGRPLTSVISGGRLFLH